MNHYLAVLKKYAEFNGRSSRTEFWMYTLFNIIISVVLQVLIAALPDMAMIFTGVLLVYALGTLIPSLAVAVRRLHDIGKSGWAILFGLIPVIGGIILIVFYVKESQPGTNQFGPNPHGA